MRASVLERQAVQIGRDRILIKTTGLILLDPDPDQVARDVVAFGKPVQGLAAQVLLGNLPLVLGAIGSVLRHGSSFGRPARGVNCETATCPALGAHSNQGSMFNAV